MTPLPMSAVPPDVLISVVICTWNREQLLRQTLTHLSEQSVSNTVRWELLVVNNNCTDGTSGVVSDFKGRLPIREVAEPTAGLSNARNRGIQEARGEYLLFTDDDVLVGERWLDRFAAGVKQFPDAAAFGGPIEPWFPVAPDPDLFAAFPALQRGFCGLDHDLELGPLESNEDIYGANMAFRADAIDGLRFDPSLGTHPDYPGLAGEESDLVNRIRARGGVVVWLPDVTVKHYVAPTRMTIGYLKTYSRDRGRYHIKRAGVPAGAPVMGVPRWLIRRCAEAWLRSAFSTLLGRRQQQLIGIRDFSYFRGMIAECFDAARRTMREGSAA